MSFHLTLPAFLLRQLSVSIYAFLLNEKNFPNIHNSLNKGDSSCFLSSNETRKMLASRPLFSWDTEPLRVLCKKAKAQHYLPPPPNSFFFVYNGIFLQRKLLWKVQFVWHNIRLSIRFWRDHGSRCWMGRRSNLLFIKVAVWHYFTGNDAKRRKYSLQVFPHTSSGFSQHLWFAFRCLTVFIVVTMGVIYSICVSLGKMISITRTFRDVFHSSNLVNHDMEIDGNYLLINVIVVFH